MRCYFITTKLETTSINRPELRRLFLEIYPGYTNVTEQRLVDQKRVIVMNNRLSSPEIEEIKRQVAIQLAQNDQEHPPLTQELHAPNVDMDLEEPNAQSHTANTEPPRQTINEDTVAFTLCSNLIKWSDTDPNSRPLIPKLRYSKTAHEMVKHVNSIITTHIRENTTLEQLQCLTYCAALTVTQLSNPVPTKDATAKTSEPKWKIRIKRSIEKLRSEIGRITQYLQGNRHKRLINKISNVLTENRSQGELTRYLDIQKQKLSVYAARLKRYQRSFDRRKDNQIFKSNEKRFYNDLTKTSTATESQELPTCADIETYWKELWSRPKTHTADTQWIKEEYKRHEGVEVQANITVTEGMVTQAINKTHNWKSAGPDRVQNYWYKQMNSLHPHLATCIQHVIYNPADFPLFLTEGKTIILPKNQDTKNPSNYRPITCLSTLYKIITSVITVAIGQHIEANNILTEEQKGCKKGSRGCKEQMVIDSVILKQAEKNKRSLYIAYIDYQKAFDSIPHSWLVETLQIYKINSYVIEFLKHIMQSWRTKIVIGHGEQQTKTSEIRVNTGIFQGDSLSAFWFCLCLNPISNTLLNTKYGFYLKYKGSNICTVNHLLYMDDLKLYAAKEDQLQKLIDLTHSMSTDIGMLLGTKKCKVLGIERGKWRRTEDYTINADEAIENMALGEVYKYLGVDQNSRYNHKEVKRQLITVFSERLRKILSTNLNAKNLTRAINTYVIPVLTYSFGVINWSNTELEQINRTVRTNMTKFRNHHPKTCIQRLTLPRTEGGRGLVDVAGLHHQQISALRRYFHTRTHNIHNAVTQIDEKLTPLNLADRGTTNVQLTSRAQKKEEWAGKELHGRFYNQLHQPHIDVKLSCAWLTNGTLYPETEGFMLGIQDQVIATRNYMKYIIKDPSVESDVCRKCRICPETIDHVITGCKLLAATDYTDRHNNVAKILHIELARKCNLENIEVPYYKHHPQSVLESNTYRLYYDHPILTDKTVQHNRPDLTLVDKTTSTTYLIDVSIPADTNIQHKYTEKVNKYTPLAIEVERIWKMDSVKIVPVIMSAKGLTPKSFCKALETINVDENVHGPIQKSVILATCNIVRKFLRQ